MKKDKEKENLFASLNDKKRVLIKLIGKTGIVKNQELAEVLKEQPESDLFHKNGEFHYRTFIQTMIHLKEEDYIQRETIQLSENKNNHFSVFELTEFGAITYKNLTNEEPVKTQKQQIIEHYGSALNGYFFEESVKVFEEKGYTVYTKPEDVTLKKANGTEHAFSLVLEKNNEKHYVKLVNRYDFNDRFNQDMNDTYQVLTLIGQKPVHFYFLAPEPTTLFMRARKPFAEWIKDEIGFEQVKGRIVVHFSTFDDIKKRKEKLWITIDLNEAS